MMWFRYVFYVVGIHMKSLCTSCEVIEIYLHPLHPCAGFVLLLDHCKSEL